SRVPSPYSHFTLRRPHSFPTRRSSDLKEALTLSILNIFLQIKRNSLRNTEIFHIRRYLETHLFTHSEEVVYSIFTGKNHCRMFCKINAFFSYFFRRNSLYMNKTSKVKF